MTHPPNSYFEILTPNVMALDDETFGKHLDHEDGALINEIRALILEAPWSSQATCSMWGHIEKITL